MLVCIRPLGKGNGERLAWGANLTTPSNMVPASPQPLRELRRVELLPSHRRIWTNFMKLLGDLDKLLPWVCSSLADQKRDVHWAKRTDLHNPQFSQEEYTECQTDLLTTPLSPSPPPIYKPGNTWIRLGKLPTLPRYSLYNNQKIDFPAFRCSITELKSLVEFLSLNILQETEWERQTGRQPSVPES